MRYYLLEAEINAVGFGLTASYPETLEDGIRTLEHLSATNTRFVWGRLTSTADRNHRLQAARNDSTLQVHREIGSCPAVGKLYWPNEGNRAESIHSSH